MKTEILEVKHSTILNTYALLKAEWIKDDYISSFIPLAATLINKKQYKIITLEDFSRDFSTEYDIKLPSHPANMLLKILSKEGYIEYEKDYCTWRPNFDMTYKCDISVKLKAYIYQYDIVIDKIIQFAEKNGYEITSSESVSKLLCDYIRDYSNNIFGEISFNNDLTTLLIPDFIKYVCQHDSLVFEFIKKIAIGHMLAEAITLEGNGSDSYDFSGLNIYLDTRFIVRLLGLSGEYRMQAHTDLIKKLQKNGANLWIWDHTIDEVSGILRGCERWIDDANYSIEKAGDTLRYLIRERKTRKDVQDLIITLESNIKKLNIKIDVLRYEEEDYDFQINYSDLKDMLTNEYDSSKLYDNSLGTTIEYDIRSVTGIYYRRRGYQNKKLSQARYIFLTTNKGLVWASRNYHTKYFDDTTTQTCINDITLGTLVWAHSNVSDCDSIITAKLMAECYSSMEPSQKDITAFARRVNELQERGDITFSECAALKCYGLSTIVAKPLLSTKAEFTDKNALEILDELKRNAIIKETEVFDKKIEEKDSYIAKLSKDYDIAKEELDKFVSQIKEYQENERAANKQSEEDYATAYKRSDREVKAFSIVINTLFNVFIQILLFALSAVRPWIILSVRVTFSVVSALAACSIQLNWLNLKDRLMTILIAKHLRKVALKRTQHEVNEHYQQKKNG